MACPSTSNLPWTLAVEQGALADGRFDLAAVLTEGLVAAEQRGLDALHQQLRAAGATQ